MWGHAIRTRGASSGRSVAQRAARDHVSRSCLSTDRCRALSSSAQQSSWVEGPFAMTTAPALSHIQNPTAERVIMKSFVDTLGATARVEVGCLDVEAESDSLEETIIVTESVVETTEISEQGACLIHEEYVSVSLSTMAVPQEGADRNVSNENSSVSADQDVSNDSSKTDVIQKNTLHGNLVRAIRDSDAEKASHFFLECTKHKVPIEVKHLLGLFNNAINKHDPITALRALQCYREVTDDPATHEFMYARLCEAVGRVPWSIARSGLFVKMVLDLQQDLTGLDEKCRRRCFPVLLVSLVQQPITRIGRMAKGLYEFMEQNDYPLTAQRMSHILSVSKYKRQGDLSFPSVLARLVNTGFRPYPPVAIHVLQNLFPYTNVDETIVAMKAIVKLQSSWQVGDQYPNYRVDLGTLEHIMAAAARKGSFDLNLLVWDLMDLLGYEPTECMYESTIQGFVMGFRQDHNMFAVLGEMEEQGYTPSRALIRSLSRSLRFSARRVDFVYDLLASQEVKGARISVSSLNIIMSACAELGDVDRAFSTWDDFDRFKIEPNVDTYSFLLEALSLSLGPFHQQNDVQRRKDTPGCLDAAYAILSLMEENGVPLCQHCIDNYAQLLYNAGRLDAATEFLVDSIEKGEIVGNKTIIVMAKNNAQAGNFDVARHLASKTTEHFGHVDYKINEFEMAMLGAHDVDVHGKEESEQPPEGYKINEFEMAMLGAHDVDVHGKEESEQPPEGV